MLYAAQTARKRNLAPPRHAASVIPFHAASDSAFWVCFKAFFNVFFEGFEAPFKMSYGFLSWHFTCAYDAFFLPQYFHKERRQHQYRNYDGRTGYRKKCYFNAIFYRLCSGWHEKNREAQQKKGAKITQVFIVFGQRNCIHTATSKSRSTSG